MKGSFVQETLPINFFECSLNGKKFLEKLLNTYLGTLILHEYIGHQFKINTFAICLVLHTG